MEQTQAERQNRIIRKQNRKRKLYYVILFICIAVIVIAFDIFFLAAPDRKLSETENRNLQQAPKLTFATLTNGRFESAFEKYVADQFPMRDSWVSLKSNVDRISGKTEANHIFLCKDGYLIQDLILPSEEKYAENMAEIEDFAKAHSDLKIHALIAPSALSVCADLLPANAVTGDENAFMDRVKEDISGMGINYVDVRDAIKKAYADDQVYYRTDHHWTTTGAYAAYKELAKTLNLPGKGSTYAVRLVTDSFSGTLTASSGFRTNETDRIDVYLPNAQIDYSVMYVDEGLKTASFYKTENLEVRDKYTVFFNGNHPEIKIETDSPSKEVLLVIKDSYANCFVPFLAGDYRTIIMIDPRYYTGDLNELIEVEGITEVLYLYNIFTLAE